MRETFGSFFWEFWGKMRIGISVFRWTPNRTKGLIFIAASVIFGWIFGLYLALAFCFIGAVLLHLPRTVYLPSEKGSHYHFKSSCKYIGDADDSRRGSIGNARNSGMGPCPACAKPGGFTLFFNRVGRLLLAAAMLAYFFTLFARGDLVHYYAITIGSDQALAFREVGIYFLAMFIVVGLVSGRGPFMGRAVWVSKSGTSLKFHKSKSCIQSARRIPRIQAFEMGYAPCEKCS